ncbi:hypothetical protein LPC08_07695 [Roseomonas sp. OT10]|uniref:hypothetical protein n=1 Tax=Roseomonas cutis TaxID=2897332 RepID=UPI001E35B203|nr:hypothetical protein [Roseomonas sp. OT10]UFN50490.1 hypothetical protein LPC08_07695 [Roseomonas sp. OT10]
MMFGTAASFTTALRQQVAAHVQNLAPPDPKVWPLDLMVAFPALDGRNGLGKYRDLGQIAVEMLPGPAARVRYPGWPIPYLYIDPLVNGYDPAFRREILATVLPAAEHGAVLSGQAVDHVFPREQAKRDGIGFVLLLPCARGVNSAHGGGIERRMTGQEKREAKVYRADWTTLIKMGGLAPPSIAQGADLRAQAANLTRELSQVYPQTVGNTEATRDSVASYLRIVQTGHWGA